MMAGNSPQHLFPAKEHEPADMLDRRIAEMRRILAEMQPGSVASALRALRDAFPEASLEERVRAITATRQ
jgi:hypothetical protein